MFVPFFKNMSHYCFMIKHTNTKILKTIYIYCIHSRKNPTKTLTLRTIIFSNHGATHSLPNNLVCSKHLVFAYYSFNDSQASISNYHLADLGVSILSFTTLTCSFLTDTVFSFHTSVS